MQTVEAASTPSGALVFLNGVPVGSTPVKFTVNQKDKQAGLRFEMDGYQPATISLTRGLSGYLGADLLFGVVPWSPTLGQGDFGSGPPRNGTRAALSLTIPAVLATIDLVSGGAFRLPSKVHVQPQPVRPPDR